MNASKLVPIDPKSDKLRDGVRELPFNERMMETGVYYMTKGPLGSDT